MMWIVAVLMTAVMSALPSEGSIPPEFHFELRPGGNWSISVDGDIWLQSGPVWFNANNKTCSTADGSIQLTKTYHNAGRDNIGAWNRTIFTFQCTVTQAAVEAHIVTYSDHPIVVWGQKWLQDTFNTSSGDRQKTVSGFPTFQLNNDTAPLHYYAYRGYMSGYAEPSMGRWSNADLELKDGDKVGPITLFPATRSGRVGVVSPSSEFMSWSLYHDKNNSRLDFGMLGLAEMIPRGMLPWQMFYYGNQGVNKAYRAWGEALQTYWATHNSPYRESDFTSDYLGYWTDGGACYYYWTETGQTYEQTIINAKLYGDKMNLPYRYIQYDSWWYPKDKQQGMLSWTPTSDVFPHGIQSLVNQTGVGASAHIKWWSPHTPLAKQNGGKYDFIVEDRMALPVDPRLYDDVLNAGRKWGVRTLEEDWFGQMWDGLACLKKNVTLASTWMLYMYEGVATNGMTLQQCTTYPRHVYMGLQIPVVTQQRVSNDYRPGHDQWKIGLTSLWVNSLGQRPFKDCFWSTDSPQYCSSIYRGYHESAPMRQAIVATLSTGPVAPADRIGDSDRELIIKCCRSDGLILKPDQAATAIDDMFYEAALGDDGGPAGQVWSTYSVITGHMYGIVFVAELKEDFTITPRSAGISTGEESIIFPRDDPKAGQPFSESQPFRVPASTAQAELYYTAPVFTLRGQKVSVLGDLTKWVPMSSRRVYQLEVADDDIAVEMTGAAYEKVPIWYMIDNKLNMTVCHTERFQRVTLSVMTGQCGRG